MPFVKLMWKNIVEPDRQTTDDNVAHAHCMLDTKYYKLTLRIWNIIAFPLQKLLHESASVLRYAYLAYLICLLSCYCLEIS